MIVTDLKQRALALNEHESFIVQAPAGSGKTELLTQRILTLLSKAVTVPEEIIAITFTRKAAREMRERVINALHFASQHGMPDEEHQQTTWKLASAVIKKDRQQKWQLLSNPNRLNILTIDSLTAAINSKTPLLSQIGSQPDITEQAEPYYTEAIESFLLQTNEQNEYGQALNVIMMQCDNKTRIAKRLFSQLLARRQQWLPYIMQNTYSSSDIKQSLEDALASVMLDTCQQIKNSIDPSIFHQILTACKLAGQALAQDDPTNNHTILANLPDSLQLETKHLPYWKQLADMLTTKSGSWRKSFTKKQGFHAKSIQKNSIQELMGIINHNDELAEQVHELSLCGQPTYSDTQWGNLQALLQALPHLVAHLTVVFKRYNTIDFTELTLAALRALGTNDHPTDITLYLDHTIKHLLVDEFQDTSISQLDLLQKITSDWYDGDHRTAFFVGDPMQSIYRFRGAEVSLFLHTQNNGFGNILLTPINLQMNFRSNKQIVKWINDSFASIFPLQNDTTYGAIPLSQATSIHNDTKNAVFYYGHNQEDAESQGELIANHIKDIQKENPEDSIAILVRSRNQLRDILPALEKFKIPKQSTDIDALYYRSEIQDLLSLTRAITNINDKTAWLALLRSPYCGLQLQDLLIIANNPTSNTIWHSIQSSETTAQLTADGKDRINRIIATMEYAITQQGRNTVTHTVKYSWLNIGGGQTLKDKQALNHCHTFFDLLMQLEQQQTHIQIDSLENKMQRLFASPSSDNNQSVSIMTIHKSKGLEFDHVIIPHLETANANITTELFLWQERATNTGGSHLLLAPMKASDHSNDTTYDMLKRHEQKKQHYETQRLLYVACTRAKKTLHLFCTLSQNNNMEIKNPLQKSFLAMLWPSYKSEFSEHLNQYKNHKTSSNKDTMDTTKKEFNHYALPSNHKIENWPKLEENQKLPPSFNSKTIEFNLAEEQTNDNARIIGIVIHNILYMISSSTFAIDNTIISQQTYKLLRTFNIDPFIIDETANNIISHIENVLNDDRGKWILSNNHKQHHSEYKITYNKNNMIKKLIIDRIIIDEKDKLWIIDYKSSLPAPGQSMPDFYLSAKEQHIAQLNRYAFHISKIYRHEIKLALYFPCCLGWTSFKYSLTNEKIQIG